MLVETFAVRGERSCFSRQGGINEIDIVLVRMSDEQHQVTFYLRKFYDQFLDKVCSHHPGASYTRIPMFASCVC